MLCTKLKKVILESIRSSLNCLRNMTFILCVSGFTLILRSASRNTSDLFFHGRDHIPPDIVRFYPRRQGSSKRKPISRSIFKEHGTS